MRFSKLAVLALVVTPASAFFLTKPVALVPLTVRSRRACRPLFMAGEIEGARFALDSLPLLIAPTAALAAGAQGLSQKKALQENVEEVEESLSDIKQKISNTDVQITASFGVAVVSVGLVAAQVFGLPNGQPSAIATTSISDETQAKLVPTAAQEEVQKIVEEMQERKEAEKIEATSEVLPSEEPKAIVVEDSKAAMSEQPETAVSPVESAAETPALEEMESPSSVVVAEQETPKVDVKPVTVSPFDALLKKFDMGSGEKVSPEKVIDVPSLAETLESTTVPSGDAATETSSVTTETPPVVEDVDTSSPIESLIKKIETAGESMLQALEKPDVATESQATPPFPMTTPLTVDESTLELSIPGASTDLSKEEPAVTPNAESIETTPDDVLEAPKAESIETPKTDVPNDDASQFDTLLKKLETTGESVGQSVESSIDTLSKADAITPEAEPTPLVEENVENEPTATSPFDSILKKLETTGESIGKMESSTTEITPSTEPSVTAPVSEEPSMVETEDPAPLAEEPSVTGPDIPALVVEQPNELEIVVPETASTVEAIVQKVETESKPKAAEPAPVAVEKASSFIDFVTKQGSTEIQKTPALSSGLDINPVVFQAAGLVGVIGVVGAVLASSSSSDATSSSSVTMPAGTKKKDATYLDGLTRSTASTSTKKSSPSSYLDTLKSSSQSSTSSKGGATLGNSYVDSLKSTTQSAPKATGGTPLGNSYLDSVASSKQGASQFKPTPVQQQEAKPLFGFGQGASAQSQARAPPAAVTQKESKPFFSFGQGSAEAKLPIPPESLPPIPKVEPPQAPAINGANGVTTTPNQATAVQSSPGMSYLESVSSKSNQDVSSKVKPSSFAPFGSKPSAMSMGAGSSYLESVKAFSVNGPPPNGSGVNDSNMGMPPQPPQGGPNGSYLSGLDTSNSDSRQPQSPQKVVAGNTGSYLDNL